MSNDRTDRCHTFQPQLAAYALGAAEDEPELLAHLAGCAACQRALRAYTQVAQVLPYTAQQVTPAPELRARILAAAASAPAPVEARAPTRRPSPTARSRWRPALTWGFVAALVLGLLGWNATLQTRLNAQAAQLSTLTEQVANSRKNWQTMTQVLNTPELQAYALTGTRAHGRFWAAPQSTVACLVAEDLPDPGAGKVYQVWLIQGDRQVGAGTFVPQAGSGWILIPVTEPLAAYQAVGVTIEPRGGSPAPTGQGVLQGALAISAPAGWLPPTERITFTPYSDLAD